MNLADSYESLHRSPPPVEVTEVTLPDGFSVQLRLENAFDKRYEVASGYYTMRRSLFGTVRYDLR